MHTRMLVIILNFVVKFSCYLFVFAYDLFLPLEFSQVLVTSTIETIFDCYVNKTRLLIPFTSLRIFYISHRYIELIVKYNSGLKPLCNRAYWRWNFMVILFVSK